MPVLVTVASQCGCEVEIAGGGPGRPRISVDPFGASQPLPMQWEMGSHTSLDGCER